MLYDFMIFMFFHEFYEFYEFYEFQCFHDIIILATLKVSLIFWWENLLQWCFEQLNIPSNFNQRISLQLFDFCCEKYSSFFAFSSWKGARKTFHIFFITFFLWHEWIKILRFEDWTYFVFVMKKLWCNLIFVPFFFFIL